MAELRSEVGNRFGRLVVASRGPNTPGGKARWSCVCDCGGRRTAQGGNLRSGATTSCGCVRSELRAETNRKTAPHGMSGSPTHRSYRSMILRCETPSSASFANYGGRGIGICARWRASFQAFFEDMGARPAGHTLDRIDNERGYEPGNCRWATPSEQARNRRPPRRRDLG